MSEIVKINPEEYGISEQKAIEVQQSFAPVIAEKDALSEIYSELITSDISLEVCKKARELRLKFVKVRTSTAKIHKAKKSFFLAAGKFVDAWKNKNVASVQVMEEKLSEIENYYIELERKKIAELQESRASQISVYVKIVPETLGEMSDEVWTNYFNGSKAAYDAKIETERKAEEERIAKEKAENEERDRIRLENERLKKEAQEREEKAKAERAERERKARIEREKQAAILKAEQEKAAKIAAELKAKKEAEKKAEQAAEAARQAELNKGDAAKVQDLISDLELIKTKYSFKSDENKKMYNGVSKLLTKVQSYVHR